MSDNDDLRRQWFKRYITNRHSGVIDPIKDNLWYTCPCCFYPILRKRGGYDICCLCSWEDDGQDDPRADEVWGGPNGRYSLTEARENFKRYWVMYSPDNDMRITAGDSDVRVTAKRMMAAAFDRMVGGDDSEQAHNWQTVSEARAILREEQRRRIHEYEQKIKETDTDNH